MIDAKQVKKSRNARLNKARRSADALLLQLHQYEGSSEPILEQEFWAEVRDLAADIHLSVHEANAYNNVLAGNSWSKIGSEP